MEKKRRYSDIESLTETKEIDWDYCIICQIQTNEKLECPADLKRKGYDPIKTYQNIKSNINRFRELNSLPSDFILSPETCSSDLFTIIKAKFHKLCRNKFRDMKVQRLVERLEQQILNQMNLDDQQEMSSETNSQVTRPSTRPSTSRNVNDCLCCFFCDKESPANLRRASTFTRDK